MESANQARPSSRFRLVIFGAGTVRTVPLVGSKWVIGRSPECSIQVQDPTVSRKHILIERNGDSFRYQDLGGSNPILLEGKPVKQGVLEPGQFLQVGLTRVSLEARRRPARVTTLENATVVLSREVIDDESPSPPPPPHSFASVARRVLEYIEWTFADLGDLTEVAEPLLELALNLAGRRRGVIARFVGQGLETLASIDTSAADGEVRLPEQVIEEARRLGRPTLLTMEEGDRAVNRLTVLLGPSPDGILVLEEPVPEALAGQELLRLGRMLGAVAWHRLQEATERLRLREDVQRLRFQGTTAHNALLTSTRLHALRQRLRELANLDHAVLLIGEQGTEREDLAHYLHVEGTRSREPFVAVDCAGLPDWRREKDLFGDARGHAGAVQRAAGGTLFIDHIDGLPQYLQERIVAAVRPRAAVGEQAAAIPRLVAGASVGPGQAPGAWWSSLAELFEPAQLTIPPLRDDPRDVLALAELFLSSMGCTPDGSPRLLNERAKRALLDYPWPGNLRELRQVLESAAARAGNQQVTPRHLPEELADGGGTGPAVLLPTLDEVQQRHIREVLQRLGGNRAKAAQVLGIAASTLYEKLRRYSIEP